MDKQKDDNQKDYGLYTEKIKENPIIKYKLWFDILKIAGMAVLFGAVAAVVFVAVVRCAGILDNEEQSRPTVTIAMDDYPGTIIYGNVETTTLDGTDTPETTLDSNTNPTSGTEPTSGETVFHSELSDYLNEVMDYINPSMVTVTAIAKNEDPILSIVENQTSLPGVIIGDNNIEYLILTSDVIAKADMIRVSFANGVIANGKLIEKDNLTHMAVVAVAHFNMEIERNIKIAKLSNSYQIKQGDLVLARGNWNGLNDLFDYGVVMNNMEVVYETDSQHTMLYTNMRGGRDCVGFLFNQNGELGGWINKDASVNNLVAYGISDLKIRLQNLTNQKAISYLGIFGQTITEQISEKNKVPRGVYISKIETYSPAFYAGLQYGDIIVDINGTNISSLYGIERLMCELEPEQEVLITVQRLGRNGYVLVDYRVTLGKK